MGRSARGYLVWRYLRWFHVVPQHDTERVSPGKPDTLDRLSEALVTCNAEPRTVENIVHGQCAGESAERRFFRRDDENGVVVSRHPRGIATQQIGDAPGVCHGV